MKMDVGERGERRKKENAENSCIIRREATERGRKNKYRRTCPKC